MAMSSYDGDYYHYTHSIGQFQSDMSDYLSTCCPLAIQFAKTFCHFL